MMKYALLIGCAHMGLTGPDTDVIRMEQVLRAREFQITTLTGDQASRPQILHHLTQLCVSLTPEACVVIYFSGHGGLLHAQTPEERSLASYVQFLVPTDMAVDHFTGITQFELSQCLAQFTSITSNVTLILDCCHATRFVRSEADNRRIRALKFDGLVEKRHHLFQQASRALSLRNPQIVGVFACGTLQPAYEYQDLSGEYYGIFTKALCTALGAHSDHVSWSHLGQWIREFVLFSTGTQRPDLAGPVARIPFQNQTLPRHTFSFFYQGSQPALRAGHLHGVREGDTFQLGHKDEAAIAQVSQVFESHSHLMWTESSPALIPPGMQAQRLHSLFPRYQVICTSAALDNILEETYELCTEASASTPIARITELSFTWQLEAYGQIIIQTSDPERLLEALAHLANARKLRLLETPETNTGQMLQWGTRTGGQIQELPKEGATLNNGDPIYISYHNTRTQPVFLNLFNIDLYGHVTLLNTDQRSGSLLVAGELAYFGYDPHSQEMWWCIQIQNPPKTAACLETLVAVITLEPVDLSHWQHPTTRMENPYSPAHEVIAINYLVITG